jgi:hypothetical protein
MSGALTLHVAVEGEDSWPGTQDRPLRTLHEAQHRVRQGKREHRGPITVLLHGGTHELATTLELSSADSGTESAPVTYRAAPGEWVTISGGRRLDCRWQPYRDGIMQCRLPSGQRELDFSQLFVNGERQTRARYPDRDDSDPKTHSGHILAAGKIADDIPDPHPGPNDDMLFSGGAPRGMTYDPATFTAKRWAKPHEAVIHIFQSHYWGNLQWQLKDVDWRNHRLWFGHGGQQMGAKWAVNPCDVDHRSRFFIENVFEELDVPGEWYFDRQAGVLYFMPPQDLDLETAIVEVPLLQQLVRFVGSADQPVQHLLWDGFRFALTASTFLEPYAVPSLSDWAIHRGGALYLEGTRDCTIRDCFFDAVGGNAVFMNGYNRANTVTGCRFTETGDSAICFVGSLETTVGTQRNFPYECHATNNLIHECGAFGKQIAGVYISRAKRINVTHNEIFRMPRAAVCIGDGTWGGHRVEYNIFRDTCRETGDHGPFNAWGRDKYWCLVQSHLPHFPSRSHDAGNVCLDAMEPVYVRYNFCQENAGWGIDMDDGASNYVISHNLCLGVSVKLREGAYRTIENNIFVHPANSPCFHVGNEDNHDRYVRNICVMATEAMKAEDDLNFEMGHGFGELYTLIAPPARGPWLAEIDDNCFYSDLGQFAARVWPRPDPDGQTAQEGVKYSLDEWRALGFDRRSVFADPLFVDPARGDYRVRPESPALALGFENYPMDRWGLTADFPARWRGPSAVTVDRQEDTRYTKN